MSFQAINWAWQQAVSGSTKLVLIALADSASPEGECWPGRKAVAKMCGITDRSVTEHIGKLVILGLISYEEQRRKDGSRSTNLYQLNLRDRVVPLEDSSIPLEAGFHTPGSGVPDSDPSSDPSSDPMIFPTVRSFIPLRGFEAGFRKMTGENRETFLAFLTTTNCNIAVEVMKMSDWLDAHRSRKGTPAFVMSWLERNTNGTTTQRVSPSAGVRRGGYAEVATSEGHKKWSDPNYRHPSTR